MPFRTTVRRLPNYVQWRVGGPTSLENFAQLVEEAAQQTRLRGDTRVMVDLREVEGQLKFTEQFAVGELVADKLQHLVRVASVVPPDQITRNSERVAQKKGLQLRVFASEAEAAEWLSSPAP